MTVRLGRVHEEPNGGARWLIDRLWPRGLTRADAALDGWAKDVAPSHELRKWFAHDESKWAEFVTRYEVELATPERAEALAGLAEVAAATDLVLLTATKNPSLSHAEVLRSHLDGHP